MLDKTVLVLALAFSLSSFATAASVEVNWNNPDSYSDIRQASLETKKSFTKRLFSELEAHIEQLTKTLPENEKLVMNFSNVRLAGNLENVRDMDQVRVIHEYDPPAKLAFSYTLKDASGNTLKQDDENLKSSTVIGRRITSEAFAIEKQMLTRWFKKTF